MALKYRGLEINLAYLNFRFTELKILIKNQLLQNILSRALCVFKHMCVRERAPNYYYYLSYNIINTMHIIIGYYSLFLYYLLRYEE